MVINLFFKGVSSNASCWRTYICEANELVYMIVQHHCSNKHNLFNFNPGMHA